MLEKVFMKWFRYGILWLICGNVETRSATLMELYQRPMHSHSEILTEGCSRLCDGPSYSGGTSSILGPKFGCSGWGFLYFSFCPLQANAGSVH
jgi:hypothetical protein